MNETGAMTACERRLVRYNIQNGSINCTFFFSMDAEKHEPNFTDKQSYSKMRSFLETRLRDRQFSRHVHQLEASFFNTAHNSLSCAMI